MLSTMWIPNMVDYDVHIYFLWELYKRSVSQTKKSGMVRKCYIRLSLWEIKWNIVLKVWLNHKFFIMFVNQFLVLMIYTCRRAMSSSSVDGVCAMLNHACAILEQDFREVLYGRLRQGFPSGFDFVQAYNLVQSSIQQGKLQSSDLETQKAKTAFLVSLTLNQWSG